MRDFFPRASNFLPADFYFFGRSRNFFSGFFSAAGDFFRRPDKKKPDFENFGRPAKKSRFLAIFGDFAKIGHEGLGLGIILTSETAKKVVFLVVSDILEQPDFLHPFFCQKTGSRRAKSWHDFGRQNPILEVQNGFFWPAGDIFAGRTFSGPGTRSHPRLPARRTLVECTEKKAQKI